MSTSAVSDQLERIQRLERRAGREAWMSERRAVSRCGGKDILGAWKPIDPAGRVRAVRTFRCNVRAACGCREFSCSGCSSRGCACQQRDCAICGCQPNAAFGLGVDSEGTGARVGTRRLLFPAANQGNVNPTDISPNWQNGGTSGVKIPDFDMHSHLFCASEVDWALTEWGLTETSTNARIDWLYNLQSFGVARMALSGMYDHSAVEWARAVGPGGGGLGISVYEYPVEGSYPVDGEALDDVVDYAWNRYPDYFVPFVRGFQNEGGLNDPNAPEYIASWLDAGFAGVGELIVHGHGSDYDYVTSIVDIFRAAAQYSAPVLVHWEIGRVPPGRSSASQNFLQLKIAIRYFPNEEISSYTQTIEGGLVPVKVILAHCGAGPQAGTMTPDELSDYTDRIDELLEDFPNVYFDIAGLVGAVPDLYDPASGNPTPVGAMLLSRMADDRYTHRFLIGLDAESRNESLVLWYGSHLVHYQAYLRAGGLRYDQQRKVRYENAFNALHQHYLT